MKKTQQAILPVLLPPSILRPIAFRIFTKKHSLTVTSASLQTLASFVGSHCGAGWREEGLAELLLDEVARGWKNAGGGVIVEESQNTSLKAILDRLESRINNGRILPLQGAAPELVQRGNKIGDEGKRHTTIDHSDISQNDAESPESQMDAQRSDRSMSDGPGQWIKVVNAFDQPRVAYNVSRRDFESSLFFASLFPSPTHKVSAFRDRYNRVYQRVLRNKAFQQPSMVSTVPRSHSRPSESVVRENYNLTFVSSLQGRGGTSHLLLGLLHLSPVGDFCLSDLTGSIVLDIRHAKGVPEGGAWFAPGMVLLVDGIYEDETAAGSQLSGTRGIGGIIGGRFIALSIAGPPCERREVTLGINSPSTPGSISMDGFGWTDFLGVGSERAEGPRMRRIMKQYSQQPSSPAAVGVRTQVVIMNEINLDNPGTPTILRNIFKSYDVLADDRAPLAFLMIGNFTERAAMCRGEGAGSIEYKELFDRLALVLSEFSRLVRNCIFIFVPGDNDPWSSSFCVGAAAPIPREPIPDIFTSRIRRVFNAAKEEIQPSEVAAPGGRAIWASNPARLSIFGPAQELVVFRDDISERLRRTSLNLGNSPCQKPTEMPATGSAEERHDRSPSSSHVDHNATCALLEAAQSLRPRSTCTIKSVEPETVAARRLVKSLLDQGHLSPFPTTVRPVFWDYASALHLYPLPTALILADPATEPFLITYEGCHVMNPGKLVSKKSPDQVTWIEYNILTCKGSIQTRKF